MDTPHEWMVIGPTCWGRDHTLGRAILNSMRNGRLKHPDDVRAARVPKGSSVNNMGGTVLPEGMEHDCHTCPECKDYDEITKADWLGALSDVGYDISKDIESFVLPVEDEEFAGKLKKQILKIEDADEALGAVSYQLHEAYDEVRT